MKITREVFQKHKGIECDNLFMIISDPHVGFRIYFKACTDWSMAQLTLHLFVAN